MSNLAAQHPDLSLHLTDSTLTPLITSSSSPSHLDSLTSLASTALTSHSAVARVNLGEPQRIMVEYPDRGAVVLQSYIEPPPPPSQSRPASAQHHLNPQPQNTAQPTAPAATAADGEDAPPRLVGVVVAGSADQAREARRAAARLERVGRDFQKEWAADGTRTDSDDTTV